MRIKRKTDASKLTILGETNIRLVISIFMLGSEIIGLHEFNYASSVIMSRPAEYSGGESSKPRQSFSGDESKRDKILVLGWRKYVDTYTRRLCS